LACLKKEGERGILRGKRLKGKGERNKKTFIFVVRFPPFMTLAPCTSARVPLFV
jgi:hypothetical protein